MDPITTNCNRQDCFPCKSVEPGETSFCHKNNITYKIKCNECEKVGLHRSFEGETFKNAFLRGKQHESLLRNKNQKSFMWKHVLEDQPEDKENTAFKMKVTGKFTTPLRHQIF